MTTLPTKLNYESVIERFSNASNTYVYPTDDSRKTTIYYKGILVEVTVSREERVNIKYGSCEMDDRDLDKMLEKLLAID